jgi:hypothetical protein
MVLFSMLLILAGVITLQLLVVVPTAILSLLQFYLFTHILHFLFGIYLTIQYFIIRKKEEITFKLTKTIISIVLSPISAVIAYTGFFMLALTNCSAN